MQKSISNLEANELQQQKTTLSATFVCRISLNQCYEELRQFLRQKECQIWYQRGAGLAQCVEQVTTCHTVAGLGLSRPAALCGMSSPLSLPLLSCPVFTVSIK